MEAVQPRKQIKVPRVLYARLERESRRIGLSTQSYAVYLLTAALDRAERLEKLPASQRRAVEP